MDVASYDAWHKATARCRYSETLTQECRLHAGKTATTMHNCYPGASRGPTKWGGQCGVRCGERRPVTIRGWGMGLCPLPRKKMKFSFWEGVFWCILTELVWKLPWRNSLHFWCVHTVTNRNRSTCTTIWNFPVMCTYHSLMPHTIYPFQLIGAYH